MSLWVIVPVKPLRRGKSRLASVLTEEERTFLNYTMLTNTMKSLRAVSEIEHILVISRDTGALALAREFDAKTVQEDGSSDLNTALRRAIVVAQMHYAHSVMVLPDDLPLLTSSAIQSMVRLASKPPVVVIAPDRRREGTNGLVINPAGLLDVYFGPGSFEKNLSQAKLYKQVHVEIFEHPEVELDLDLPEDLELLQQRELLRFNNVSAADRR